jgi:hypothetical protein
MDTRNRAERYRDRLTALADSAPQLRDLAAKLSAGDEREATLAVLAHLNGRPEIMAALAGVMLLDGGAEGAELALTIASSVRMIELVRDLSAMTGTAVAS